MSEPAAYEPEPVCPRHPDRVAYVRCQRCGRPTCPECQRPAAVGIQCVDCVREGQKSMRMPRTQFGAPVTAGDRPVVTISIIAICAAVWLLQQVSRPVTGELAFVPVLGVTEPWRFLTAAFAHSPGSPLHILFNMFALWQIGQYLEPMLGRLRFAILYLVSAFGGSVGFLLLAAPPLLPLTQEGVNATGWFVPVVGASGAVFGLFGALLVLNRHLGRSSSAMFGVLAINAVLGFVVPGIAWQAHLGGLVTGIALAAAITATTAQGRRKLQLPALATVVVLLGVATYTMYAVTDNSVLLSVYLRFGSS
jgi:membrane associated rhomboid family serine protease